MGNGHERWLLVQWRAGAAVAVGTNDTSATTRMALKNKLLPLNLKYLECFVLALWDTKCSNWDHCILVSQMRLPSYITWWWSRPKMHWHTCISHGYFGLACCPKCKWMHASLFETIFPFLSAPNNNKNKCLGSLLPFTNALQPWKSRKIPYAYGEGATHHFFLLSSTFIEPAHKNWSSIDTV